jgi:hypothetical protein
LATFLTTGAALAAALPAALAAPPATGPIDIIIYLAF